MAARTTYEAVQAAAASSPEQRPAAAQRQAVLSPGQRVGPRQTKAASGAARRRPSEIFAPFRKATRVVSLEVMGSFFALFALPFALGVWHQWGELRSGSQAVTRFVLLCGVTVFFGYCSVSSFVRARRVR